MKSLFTLYIALFACLACAQKKEKSYDAPNGYDFSTPEKFTLSEDLQEISGITFEKGNPDLLFAQQDEEGKLFYFKPGDNTTKSVVFGKKGDYEDLAVTNNSVVMLRSEGSLFTFPLSNIKQETVEAQHWKDLLPKGEYEGLAATDEDSLLYVLCKQCSIDKKTSKTTGYILKALEGNVSNNGTFHIDNEAISKIHDLKGKPFRPSALAKNLKTNEWFILSSVNSLLVVTDNQWQVKAAYPLNPKLFNQPEGIAFDKNNSLYISNEAGDPSGAATLLKFSFNENNRNKK